eukprot:UN22760
MEQHKDLRNKIVQISENSKVDLTTMGKEILMLKNENESLKSNLDRINIDSKSETDQSTNKKLSFKLIGQSVLISSLRHDLKEDKIIIQEQTQLIDVLGERIKSQKLINEDNHRDTILREIAEDKKIIEEQTEMILVLREKNVSLEDQINEDSLINNVFCDGLNTITIPEDCELHEKDKEIIQELTNVAETDKRLIEEQNTIIRDLREKIDFQEQTIESNKEKDNRIMEEQTQSIRDLREN